MLRSGIDYWQRKLHVHHSWAMKQAVLTLLLIEQRCNPGKSGFSWRVIRAPPAEDPDMLLHLPEEIWLEILQFLRSADFDV